MNCDGKLVNSYTPNTNSKSPIVGFWITTCREISDYEGGTIIETVKTVEEYLDADELAVGDVFYRVIACYDKAYHSTKRAIGDFYSIKDAMNFVYELSGNEVHIYSC